MLSAAEVVNSQLVSVRELNGLSYRLQKSGESEDSRNSSNFDSSKARAGG